MTPLAAYQQSLRAQHPERRCQHCHKRLTRTRPFKFCNRTCVSRHRRSEVSVAARFWRHVDRASAGCWFWQGGMSTGGYGRFRLPDRTVKAHTVAYELLIGPVPRAQLLDHLCLNPPCVNPWHLDPVAERTNILRGTSPTANNARKVRCKRGHELPPPNARGWRECQHKRARRRGERLV